MATCSNTRQEQLSRIPLSTKVTATVSWHCSDPKGTTSMNCSKVPQKTSSMNSSRSPTRARTNEVRKTYATTLSLDHDADRRPVRTRLLHISTDARAVYAEGEETRSNRRAHQPKLSRSSAGSRR